MGHIGPLSQRLPFAERRSGVTSYYDSFIEPRKEISALPSINKVLSRRSRLIPLSYSTSARGLPLNTNSGLSLFQRRSKVIDQELSVARTDSVLPCVLGWRGQSSGSKIPKQRVVWMFPMSQNIRENRFFRPLHEVLKRLESFSAWISMDAVDDSVTRLLARRDTVGGTILSSDFSKFDQTMGPAQLKWYFNLLRNVYDVKFHEDIDFLQYVLAYIPLVCTLDETFIGVHGWGSGSNLTNQADSVVNHHAQITSMEVPEEGIILVQGDDAALNVYDVDRHLTHLSDLGFEANASKQYISDTVVHYLQRVHSANYKVNGRAVGVYPTMRALNSLMGQERFHDDWSSVMVSLRTLSILENVRNHPIFTRFVKYIMEKGDKSLKENTARIVKDRSYIKRAKAIPGFLPSYNEAGKLDGIRRFKSVRLILES
uniref:RdRp catalytic domain-containing protein n=1 Tax=viral metagenome TaxID=1070528 RepID=A0A2V0RLT3_9ZZZZ